VADLVHPRLSIDVPAHLQQQLGWAPGAPLSLSVEGGALIVRPFVPQPAPAPTPQSSAVLALRMSLGLTRSDMARLLDCLPSEVGAWETHASLPEHTQARLDEIAADPDAALATLDPQR